MVSAISRLANACCDASPLLRFQQLDPCMFELTLLPFGGLHHDPHQLAPRRDPTQPPVIHQRTESLQEVPIASHFALSVNPTVIPSTLCDRSYNHSSNVQAPHFSLSRANSTQILYPPPPNSLTNTSTPVPKDIPGDRADPTPWTFPTRASAGCPQEAARAVRGMIWRMYNMSSR